jgi:hypothetical protein
VKRWPLVIRILYDLKRETLKAKWTCFIILICIHELKVDIWINSWIKLVLQNRQNVNKANCLDLFIILCSWNNITRLHFLKYDTSLCFWFMNNKNHFLNYSKLYIIILKIIIFYWVLYFFDIWPCGLSASKMPNVNKASERAYCISWFAHFWAIMTCLYHTLYPKDFTDLIPKS